MNYTELQQRIQDWLEDDSDELVNALPQIIKLAEESIYYMAPRLPCYQKTAEAVLNRGRTSFPYPSGMLDIYDIMCTGRILHGVLDFTFNCSPLSRREESYVLSSPVLSSTTPSPEVYYTRNYNVYPAPVAPEEDDITYNFSVNGSGFEAPLSASNPTNWISLNAENALFNQCLTEAAKVTRKKPKVYMDDTMKALQGLVQHAENNRVSDSGRLF